MDIISHITMIKNQYLLFLASISQLLFFNTVEASAKTDLVAKCFQTLDTDSSGVLSLDEARVLMAFNMDTPIEKVEDNMVRGLNEDGDLVSPNFEKMTLFAFHKLMDDAPDEMVMGSLGEFIESIKADL